MGYRSEVAIAIAKEPANLWPEFKAGFESALAKETNGKKYAIEEFFTATYELSIHIGGKLCVHIHQSRGTKVSSC